MSDGVDDQERGEGVDDQERVQVIKDDKDSGGSVDEQSLGNDSCYSDELVDSELGVSDKETD